MADSFERLLKIGIWITATILFGWVWINILNTVPFISGLGHDSFLLLLMMTFFYLLKQALHLEFNSNTIVPESVIINIPNGQNRYIH